MLGRIINNKFVKYDGKPVSIYIANPTEEQLKLLGYKPLIEDEIPTYDEVNQYLVEKYTEYADLISKSFEIVDVESEELN